MQAPLLAVRDTRPVASPAGPTRDSAAAAAPAARRTGAESWRRLLVRPGVTYGLTHITDASGGTASMTNGRGARTFASASVDLDLDSLTGIRGLRLFAGYMMKNGRDASTEADLWQSFSNIDAPDFLAFGELYAEQSLFDSRVRIKAGRLDFNNEFAGTNHGGNFLNASMGFSPSITAAPTYPLPTTAANLFVSPTKSMTIGFGVFNGLGGAQAPAGKSSLFEIAQVVQGWSLHSSQLEGSVSFGGWRHTGMFTAIDAPEDAEPAVSSIAGWYATFNQELWHGRARSEEEGDHAVIAAFGQAGRADPRAQAIYTHAGGGFTFTGLSAHRASDVIGIGLTRASARAGHETIGEAFYQLPITSHFALEADVQRVSRQDWQSPARFGTLTTLRTIISF